MNVLVHPDPAVLEDALLSALVPQGRDDPWASRLAIVPTARLASHVQRRLAGRGRALVGVEVLHLHALALRILASEHDRPVRVVPRRVLATLLEQALAAPGPAMEDWRSYLDRRPGALRRLLAVLQELREAGISAADLAAATGQAADLAPVQQRYEAVLRRIAERGLVDRAGLAVLARRHAAGFAKRYERVVAYGAYEWVGVHGDLLREIARATTLTVLAPGHPHAPAYGYARDALDALAAAGSTALEATPALRPSRLGSSLPLLYDDTAQPAPCDEAAIGIRSFQGASAEVEWAVRSAVRAVADGVRPSEIAIVARSLDPYAGALERVLEAEGLPWTTSLNVPARRSARVRDLLLLLRVLVDGYPRAATAELLRSPRVRWEVLDGVERAPDGDLAERWSREAGVVDGLRDWTNLLPSWAGRGRSAPGASEDERTAAESAAARRRAAALAIAGCLRALESRFGNLPAGRRAFADRARGIAAVLGPDVPGEKDDPDLEPLLDDLALLDDLDPDGTTCSPAACLAWLESAVDDAVLPARPSDDGGIRVLDVMQARGMTFDRVFLLGLHAGAFPRIPREDPFLDDGSRRRLREATGRPVPLKMHGEDEEHLLLALALGSARQRLELSWQRADDAGRATASSPALREVARIVLGEPDPGRLERERVARTSAHPLRALESVREATGLLRADEERLLYALRGRGPATVRGGLLERSEDLARGLELLEAVESFAPVDLRFDARVGRRPGDARRWSVSALEQIGRCPLQFFFARVLRVGELEEEAAAHEVDARELGSRVHEVLHDLYAGLRDDGALVSDEPARPARLAASRVEETWDRITAGLGERVGARFPGLWASIRSAWIEALERFVSVDARRLAETAPRDLELEIARERRVALAGGLEVELRGRFDRRASGDRGVEVADYKTSGSLELRMSPLRMLRGESLQVPLYRMLAGGEARVRLLGVGPDYRPHDDEHAPVFDGLPADQEAGFRETLAILVRLHEEGTYPMHPDRHCGWCPYRGACRRAHPPTLAREEADPATADDRDRGGKTRKKPALADLRAGAAGGSR